MSKRIAGNGKLIGDVPEIEFRQSNLVQKLNKITKGERLFVSRHIANEMLAVRAFID